MFIKRSCPGEGEQLLFSSWSWLRADSMKLPVTEWKAGWALNCSTQPMLESAYTKLHITHFCIDINPGAAECFIKSFWVVFFPQRSQFHTMLIYHACLKSVDCLTRKSIIDTPVHNFPLTGVLDVQFMHKVKVMPHMLYSHNHYSCHADLIWYISTHRQVIVRLGR